MIQLSQPAIDVLAEIECIGVVARIQSGQLDRKLYVEVDKALRAAGGMWDRRVTGHVFAGRDPRLDIDAMLESGGYRNLTKELGFFPTPPDLAERLVSAAGVTDSDRVLEPSAGEGRLLDALPAGCRVCAVEIDHNHRAGLVRACGRFQAALVFVDDFLQVEPEHLDAYTTFDAIVMNPPFTNGIDAAHVIHAIEFLRPGGRIAAIMSAGVTFRDTHRDRAIRDLVHAWSGSIDFLPDQSFRAAGTGVRTVLLTLTKPETP